jgi:hypothetical protein
MMPRKTLVSLASLILLVLAGTGGIAFAMKKQTEKKIMEYKQALELETWAVGRFVIDIPKGADVSYSQGYRGAGADIEVFPCARYQAEKLVKARVEELQGTKHLKDGTLLERYVESKTLPYTWFLHRWEDRTFKDDMLDLDAYHWRKAPGPIEAFKENAYLFVFQSWSHPVEGEMLQAQSAVESVFRRVRIRDNREIPTEPGFCMAYSFIPGLPPDGLHSEEATITFAVPGHPDIFVRFDTNEVSERTAAGEKLLARVQRNDGDPAFHTLAIKTLRARERAVGDYKGQEHLEMVKENGLWNMQFQWEFSGFGDRWDYPAMTLEILNSRAEGSRAPLSMTQEEAMALWDAMVDSIRIRPTTKTPPIRKDGTSEPAPQFPFGITLPAPDTPAKPRSALGTRLGTGEVCPQTGIWECAHNENLGGTKRAFREGQTFQEAVLDTKRSWLGKLLGRPAETVVATAWTLVSYPDEDGTTGDPQPGNAPKPEQGS